MKDQNQKKQPWQQPGQTASKGGNTTSKTSTGFTPNQPTKQGFNNPSAPRTTTPTTGGHNKTMGGGSHGTGGFQKGNKDFQKK
jgi:hypothetical protein